MTNREKIIFFGNGPLADASKSVLEQSFEIIFHAKTKEDLETVKTLKVSAPEAHGILASFGVMIKSDVLDLFEPEGILNIHPSLLPKYRGASPIESAILAGDTEFSVSIMKLVKKMDAGPVYFQTTLTPENPLRPDLKSFLYESLAVSGANWLTKNLKNLPTPVAQDEKNATFTEKFDKKMSFLHPETTPTSVLMRQILAYQGFPKPKFAFYGHECTILAAHPMEQGETALLSLKGSDGRKIAIDRLQPAGKNPMDARSFLNGYKK